MSESETGTASHPDPLSDFVAALGEVTDIVKDKTASVSTKAGGSYSYSYANLGDLNAMLRPILARHNLAVTQQVTGGIEGVEVVTVVVHTSGWVKEYGPLLMRGRDDTPQAMGSAITYARRYSLLAAFNIATEDDDGAAASAPRGTRNQSGADPGPSGAPDDEPAAPRARRSRSSRSRATPDPALPTADATDVISPEALVGILEAFNQIHNDHQRKTAKDDFMAEFGRPHMLPADRITDAITWIEGRIAQAAADAAAAEAAVVAATEGAST